MQTLEWMFRPIPFMERCRERYGPIFSVRFGTGGRVVMLAEPRAAREVLYADADQFHAGDTNGTFEKVVGPNSILVLDGPEHMRHRRILLPVVGHHAQRYEELITGITRRRISTWRPGQELSLLPEMEAISFETIMRISFGSDGNSEREDRLRQLVPVMMDRCANPLALLPWFRYEAWGLTPAGRVAKVMRDIDEVLYDAIEERRADPLSQLRDDALSLLVRATYDDGSPLENRAIRDELLTMLMAGYETTTSGLTWSFERLLRTPDKLQRLIEELDDGREEYLDAVVTETLRCRPVIPIAARRALVPVDVLGYTLPARSVMIVALYLLHRDPQVFPKPLEFRPERFLDGSSEESHWLVFGGGVRRCLGAALAQYEMKVVLRTVLGEATLRVVEPADEPIARRRFTFSPGGEGRVMVDALEPQPRPLRGERFRPSRAATAAAPAD